ncbi:CnjB protein [Artemisia annua]|uniref:CnjB protein n=1 Tax=Artemisia annua TaxID=35608 RepID=A0A2U1Q762_ARTAN|nr:CnjB protein [Artemisia annua]
MAGSSSENFGSSVPNSPSFHDDDNVPSCFKCGSYDHIAYPCPNEGRVDLKCFNCKEVGHIGWVCEKSCCLCSETGHTGEKCPNVRCLNCIGENHISLYCPKMLG